MLCDFGIGNVCGGEEVEGVMYLKVYVGLARELVHTECPLMCFIDMLAWLSVRDPIST